MNNLQVGDIVKFRVLDTPGSGQIVEIVQQLDIFGGHIDSYSIRSLDHPAKYRFHPAARFDNDLCCMIVYCQENQIKKVWQNQPGLFDATAPTVKEIHYVITDIYGNVIQEDKTK
jgi:hypothetical protein